MTTVARSAVAHFAVSRTLPAVLFALVAAGCNGRRTAPVEGVVLLDGQPVAGAAVQFVPTGPGRDATATTNHRGEFVMSTFEPRDGVLPGTYKVLITPPLGPIDTAVYSSATDAMNAAAKPKPAPRSSFPARYSSVSETPLVQTVPIGAEKLRLELTKQ